MSNRLFVAKTAYLSPLGLARRHAPDGWRAWRRYRSRQRISELNRHILKDIGVSFAEAEANKPFWRA